MFSTIFIINFGTGYHEKFDFASSLEMEYVIKYFNYVE
jgi:hypothetical protein